eukprot:CAMPEP_0183706094 /NCGR_PEP_ID=MMETSP0737-20130205/3005_1 /TAXON_ID=385413 /ORGANISM="Thalassiosira miniscula, Strain CCMP1093" /LENGTH=497 /DNA_ID=CAMNT_0025933403 /DNA_START=182 /DNA_END=1675 /DNA_ORIENTATION=+
MSQAEFKKRLKKLMLLPENQVCSDCPERQPRWASLIVPPPGAPAGSLPMGAFCCLECSGSHRRLGVHISFVRSINLDSWKEKEVLAMENGGNDKVNAIFEARLTVSKPSNSASGAVRERFIRDKYERRKFYDPSAFERVSQMETAKVQEQVVSGVQRRLASSSRKPSDAARKRVEERAARNRSSGGGGGSARSTKPVKVPAPVPAPAPAVDLLDFGDFDSAEATSAVQASNVAPTGGVANPAPSGEPALDLFANMSVGDNTNGGGGSAANGQMQQPGQPQQQQQAAVQPPEQKKMSTADIMSMFNTPSAQPMQQNMFAMNGGMQNGMGGGMAGGNNMGMMGQQMGGGMNNNNMAMMNNMNPQQQQQMAMMNNMQMMQRNNMMGGQQGMGNMGGNMNMGMMGGQGGMGNMGGNMNNMGGNGMMQQQQQQQQQGQMGQMNNNMMAGNNNMMMMQGGGMGNGMMMQQGGGNQFGQAMGGQAQPSPQKQINQFAEFGNFGR